MERSHVILHQLGDKAVVLTYDKQSTVPMEYTNWLLSRHGFEWKGNVVLVLLENMMGERMQWPENLHNSSCLAEICNILSTLMGNKI